MAGSDKAIITAAANRYGISPAILYGLYGTETSFGKDLSTSSAGAVGPFQFLPSTARSMGVNPNDFRSAAFGAAKYLAQYKGRGVGGMLSAYNAGPAGGYQSGYVQKTLANARSYGGAPGSVPSAGRGGRPGTPGTPGSTRTETTNIPPMLNEAAFQAARQKAASNRMLLGLSGGKELRGLLSTAEPLKSAYTTPGSTSTKTIKIPGTPGTPGTPNPSASNNLHGILPEGAKVVALARKDQGRDVQLHPGQALLAPGRFVYLGTKSDPSGFGPDYPIIRVLDGRFAGHNLYYGHTDVAGGLKPGKQYAAGTHVATTSKTGHNAPPGWLELGYAPGGTPGPFGQPSPF